MISPKIFEPYRGGSTRTEEGADCFGLVKMFGSRVLRLAKYITQSDSDAEDVLVETFLKVCPDGSEPRGSEAMRVRLVAIAATEALAKVRHPGHAQGEDDPCEDVIIREISTWGDNYLDRHSPDQTADILEQAMWSLDPMCRAVFVLRDIEEIPVEQTAGALSRSVAAVEVCHLRARLQLREQLTQRFRPPLAALEDSLLGEYCVDDDIAASYVRPRSR